jgi:psp operon transcriptional activator
MVANPQLVGESQAHLDLLDHVSALAALDQPTLMTGERGTGKELFAARLHFLSPRWEGPYLSLNCASLPEDQADRRLFGVENDGVRSLGRVGVIEAADGGTLFLDEVTHLSPRLQEKLLRVIEYGTFERVDGDETVSSNVRILAATSETQGEAQPKLRADLLDRLAFGVIHIPPLRERREDIVPLVMYLGKGIAAELNLERFPGFTAEALEALLDHSWPGNVRELRTVVGRSVGFATIEREQSGEDPLAPIADIRFSTVITPDWADKASEPQANMPSQIRVTETATPAPSVELPSSTEFAPRVMVFERRLVDESLQIHGGHQGRAADHLGLSYHQFRGLLKKHGLKK